MCIYSYFAGERLYISRFCRTNMIGLNCVRNHSTDKVLPFVETASKINLPDGHIVIVEGNIGVGKTTLTCQLGRKLNYSVFLEPTSRNPYLANFYKEPEKYALKMQLWLLRQRCMMYMRAVKHWMESGLFLWCVLKHRYDQWHYHDHSRYSMCWGEITSII